MSGQEHVAIVGGGIVGVSAAIWLLRAGKKVTLLDRAPPGEGTSYGNAGVLASCSVAPVTAPGMIFKAPKMLADPSFPLYLRWSYLPKLAPWLFKYLSHANIADTKRIAEALTPMVADSVEQHQSLTAGTDAATWMTQSDYSFAYPTRAAFEADRFTWDLRKRAGFKPDLIDGDAVREFEPLLSEHIGLLAVMRHHGFISSPGLYVKSLAAEVEKLGGSVLQAEVSDVSLADGRVDAILTGKGRIPCDKLVLATGVWSKPLAKKLGLKVPLETERGYHILFDTGDKKLRSPIMVTTAKFVATPMVNGLRCAGIVEFGGLEAGPSSAPLEMLERTVKATFPGVEFVVKDTWLGHRPAPSDSLPLIGEIGRCGVYTAFGHHHIGLTAGPKTGRIISDLISNGKSNLDLSPYRPGRFGG